MINKLKEKIWSRTSKVFTIRKQHKLHQRRMKDPTPHNIRAHRKYRHELNKTIKEAKRKHFTALIEDSKHDPKQQAKVLKTIVPSKKAGRNSPTNITYKKETHTDPTDIANALNDHFITIGHKTYQTIPAEQREEECSEPENKSTHPPFQLKRITLEQTTDTMDKINPNKATDIFNIQPAILKDLTHFIAPLLTTLFNRAIDENTYPDPLKVTKVIELYKKKDPTSPKNYRPISLLPIIAKIFDTLINIQLMTHLIEHNILSPTQYAFRPNSSTTLTLQHSNSTTPNSDERKKPNSSASSSNKTSNSTKP